MTNVELQVIDGRPVADWDKQWVRLEGGLRRSQRHLRGDAGLYRFSINGEVTAIGTGTDKKGGLAKRLADFHRPSPSGRNHYAGDLTFQNRTEITVEVLVVGRSYRAREVARQLRDPMVALHKPAWTVADPWVRQRG
jgi:hypothetical protein